MGTTCLQGGVEVSIQQTSCLQHAFKAHAGEQPSFNTAQANTEKTALSLNGTQGLMRRAHGWEPQVSLGRA